ncbi:MAG: YibE/F family protein, partial [Candidatus Peribacteraceae bacterium]|nr:YibE/F family protein [Candidatus Peribacteraceae bacterium]
ITSTLGLALSIAVLAGGVTPLIAAGHDPLLVSLGGAVIIACTSLLLAHGFRRRTYIALLSTLLTLGASTLLALLAVWLSALSGLGSEETVFLQTGTLAGVDLRGLLLGGIIIGCLGVLDDITTAQTAAVDEISRANPSLGERELMRAGMSVGREHIASLTNTIALAYAGASFPLLLLLSAESRYPLWSTLNSEFFAEEIVRTLVGSATLVLAVPLSTWLAVRFLRGRPHDHRDLHHHSHSHAHGHL